MDRLQNSEEQTQDPRPDISGVCEYPLDGPSRASWTIGKHGGAIDEKVEAERGLAVDKERRERILGSDPSVFWLSKNVSLWLRLRFTHRNVAVQALEFLSFINLQ